LRRSVARDKREEGGDRCAALNLHAKPIDGRERRKRRKTGGTEPVRGGEKSPHRGCF